MAVAALMGVGTAVKGEEVPSLDLNFDGQASSYTRATTSPTAPKANGDQLATSVVTQNKSGSVQSLYMGPSGKLINGYVTNLHVNSDPSQFTLAPTAAGPSLTSGYRAPDGSMTAYSGDGGTGTAFYGATSNNHPQVTAGKVYTASCFFKCTAGEVSVGSVLYNSPTSNQAGFGDASGFPRAQWRIYADGSTPVQTHDTGLKVNEGIEYVGDGWWRTWVAATAIATQSSNGNMQAWRVDNADVGDEVLIWGVQFEEGSVPSAFVPAVNGTSSAQVPRVEYDASGTPLGLLVEEQRTNLVPNSQMLATQGSPYSQYAHIQAAATVTTNADTDPAGGNTASKITPASGTTSWYGGHAQAYTAGQTYTFSTFVKVPSGSTFNGRVGILLYKPQFNPGTNTSHISAYWDLETDGTATFNSTSSTSPEGYGIIDAGNGWYRIWLTHTCAVSGSPAMQYPRADTITAATDTLLQWGAQVEEGAGPTSFIPTDGTALQRTADDISLATSAFGYNTAAGTTAVDFTMQGDTETGYPGIFTFIDAAANWPRDILYLDSANDDLNMFSRESSTDTIWTLEAGASFPLVRSVAVRIDGTNGQDAIDGTLSASQTLGVAPSTTRTTLHVGSNGSANPMNGHVRRLRYWPRAINDAQLSKFTNQ